MLESQAPLTEKEAIHPVDVHVGQSIRRLRRLRDLTLSEVADSLGISLQQLQKYETGANRISVSKLYMISNILDTKPHYFFEGLEDIKKPTDSTPDVETLKIASSISQIADGDIKELLHDLVKLIASKNEPSAHSTL